MAKSASTGFSFIKSLIGTEHPGTANFLLAGSATVKIGDLVRVNDAGLLVRAATGTSPVGVLVGIVDSAGINAFSPRAGGTSGATLTGDDTIATASDNATNVAKNLKGQVIVDPAGVCLFKCITDVAVAQTNVLQFFDVDAGSTVTVGGSDANGQVQLVELDPNSTTSGYFRINESQFNAGLDTATAKIAA